MKKNRGYAVEVPRGFLEYLYFTAGKLDKVNEFIESLIRLLEAQDFLVMNPGVMGSGGIFVWNFRATSPGSCALHFIYRRPWETAAPIDKYIYLVTVAQGTE